MGEKLSRIPRVKTSTDERHKPLQLAAYVILVLDIAFLIWGIIRLILIAVPRLQFVIVELVFQALAFTREEYLDYTFEALQKLFLLPSVNRFNLPDVLLNTFITVLVFVMGFVLYKLVAYSGKLIDKKLSDNS